MIDMDYEQKYNDALERAKAAIDIAADKDLVKGVATTIFPELRESEDERIRKELVNFLQSPFIKENLTDEKVAPWVAYLEKQKENPKSADSIPSDCVSDAKCEDRSPKHSDSDGTDIRDTPAYWKGWDDAMKQKEQKHPNGCFTCDEYKKGYESGRLNGFTAGYNKAMKEIDQKEQKPWKVGANAYFTPEQKPAEWSYPYGRNEPVDRLVSIAECLEMDGDCLFNGYSGTKCGKFLRELARKQVECEPAEWSEEETKDLVHILKVLDDCYIYGKHDLSKTDYDNLTSTLKSLRPSWKPSKEQMEALEECGECKRCIKELYEQLKKLI